MRPEQERRHGTTVPGGFHSEGSGNRIQNFQGSDNKGVSQSIGTEAGDPRVSRLRDALSRFRSALEERADELTPEQLEQCEDGLTTIETALREPDSEAGRRLLRGGLRQFMDAAARLGGLTAVVAAVQAGVQALLS